jgi:hypothetical protein
MLGLSWWNGTGHSFGFHWNATIPWKKALTFRFLFAYSQRW